MEKAMARAQPQPQSARAPGAWRLAPGAWRGWQYFVKLRGTLFLLIEKQETRPYFRLEQKENEALFSSFFQICYFLVLQM
jgi:hypothetical protein